MASQEHKAGDLLGAVGLALCLQAKIARGVAEMPEGLVGMIRQVPSGASFDKAAAAARIEPARAGRGKAVLSRLRCVRLCAAALKQMALSVRSATLAGQEEVFIDITEGCLDKELFDRVAAAPVAALASLRSSGHGLSPDFHISAADVDFMGLSLGGADTQHLPPDLHELRCLLGSQLGLAEVRAMADVLSIMDATSGSLMPCAEDIALLHYACACVLAPVGELQQVVAAGRLLPREVDTELHLLSRYKRSLRKTTLKLRCKAGMRVPQAGMVVAVAQGTSPDAAKHGVEASTGGPSIANRPPNPKAGSASQVEQPADPSRGPDGDSCSDDSLPQGGRNEPAGMRRSRRAAAAGASQAASQPAEPSTREVRHTAATAATAAAAPGVAAGQAGEAEAGAAAAAPSCIIVAQWEGMVQRPLWPRQQQRRVAEVAPEQQEGHELWQGCRTHPADSAVAACLRTSSGALLEIREGTLLDWLHREMTDPLPAAALHLFLERCVTGCLGEEEWARLADQDSLELVLFTWHMHGEDESGTHGVAAREQLLQVFPPTQSVRDALRDPSLAGQVDSPAAAVRWAPQARLLQGEEQPPLPAFAAADPLPRWLAAKAQPAAGKGRGQKAAAAQQPRKKVALGAVTSVASYELG